MQKRALLLDAEKLAVLVRGGSAGVLNNPLVLGYHERAVVRVRMAVRDRNSVLNQVSIGILPLKRVLSFWL